MLQVFKVLSSKAMIALHVMDIIANYTRNDTIKMCEWRWSWDLIKHLFQVYLALPGSVLATCH